MASRGPIVRTLERACWSLGIVSMLWTLIVYVGAARYQRNERDAFDRSLPAPAADVSLPADVFAPAREIGGTVGRLEIPRIGLSAMIVNGDDDAILRVAVGHLPDTPLPWEPGNTAMAAHRDTFFRPLKQIRRDDEVQVATAGGTFRYRVTDLRIVMPDDLSVLQPDSAPSITLITCYPFGYIGNAPKRFVVKALRDEPVREGQVPATLRPVRRAHS